MPQTPKKRTKPAHCVAPRLVRRADALTRLLKRKKLSVVTAESCTGGLIAAAISQGTGAADVLQGGFVTYTKLQKSAALGVPAALLRRDGAVTKQVARRMAEGALKRSKAHIALAVTGVLGPKPDEDGNPVGLVIVACARGNRTTRVLENNFGPLSHDQLRCKTVLAAFTMIDDCARG